jgi:hypothetical protein
MRIRLCFRQGICHLILIIASCSLCGCKGIIIAYNKGLPIEEVSSIIATGDDRIGQRVQVYGFITYADFQRERYVIDDTVAFTGYAPSTPGIFLGKDVVVRGYLSKGPGWHSAPFSLKYPYFDETNMWNKSEEFYKMMNHRRKKHYEESLRRDSF